MKTQDIVLSAPPVTVAGASYFGYTLPEWAAITAIIYTVLLILKMVWNGVCYWRKFKKDMK
jgi:hypothetical protein